MKYKIEITETLQKTAEVNAEDENKAILKAKQLYHQGEIVLDSSDYIDTEINVIVP